MIKEALEYLVSLKRTETLTLGTKVYEDRTMEVIHDGGVWKLEAIQIIKRALEELLKEKGLADKIAILA